MSQAAKGAAFAALHESGTFVIPNPSDAGSARVLEALGFKALTTTSSGFAYTLGRLDGRASLDEVVAHVGSLAQATELPVAVDLENGYGDAPGAIRRVAEAGAVGGSIEDWEPEGSLLERGRAAERVAAAAEAAHSLGFPFTFTARAENHIRGNPDLDDTIERLLAYEEAGADVLYAPGVSTVEDVRTVCDAVSKPVNVLIWAGMPTVPELGAAGARRISVGGGLTWVGVKAFADAAAALLEHGDPAVLDAAVPLREWLA